MSNEQRKKILQILYEERSKPHQIFDREDLAQQMGIPWYDIQPEVAYLVEKGYVTTKSRQLGTRIFHMLSITTKGIDFVESGMQLLGTLKKIEVFISSPGDVYEERQIVKRVIDRCNRVHSIAERYVLRPLAYEENPPAEVGKRPQTIIDRDMMKAGSSDLFICIFWHRMGAPVTLEETGERFQSGTEYEFLDAYYNNQKRGKPYILLYRGLKPFPPETDPEQLRAVQAFFKRFEGEHAEFKGLYKTYRSNEEFEDILFHDIDTVISKNLIL
jgi:DNA-binding MarR family transcriptional regulator